MPSSANPLRRVLVLVLPLLLVIALFVWPARTNRDPIRAFNYSEFIAAVKGGQVADVVIKERTLLGKTKDGTTFTVTLPPQYAELPRLLDEYGVPQTYKEEVASPWMSLLPLVFWAALIGGMFWLQTRRMGAGGASGPLPISPRANRWLKPGEMSITFQDVAGIDEVKEDLMELVDYLKNPARYREMGARVPTGVLLYGPPGTGKTLVARAVAGEAGVPFISFSASEFVELFVGMGAARVRELFAQARKQAPCIIFIDEIDAVGRHRGPGLGGGHDEREQTLNQLLVEMDGFDGYSGVIVMAATNRPDVLDPALLRPGRFDRRLPVDRPDVKGRLEILKVHARGKHLDATVNLETVARRTAGFTGADLANLLNEAALLAVRRGKKEIGMPEIEESIDRAVAGGPEKKNRVISPQEKRRIAVHEAGHAVVGAELAPPVDKVTIIGRGMAGGYTLFHNEEDKRLFTRSDLLKRLAMLLAGRAAEELLLGEASTGASNDLERAAQMAREMVSRYGMGASLGAAGAAGADAIRADGLPDRASESMAAEVDREVRAIIADADRLAREVLQQRRAGLERIAGALVERETLDGAQVLDLLRDGAAEGVPQLAH